MTNRGPGSLSSVLRELREHALLSQEQLAQQASLSVGTVRGLESGRITRPRAVSIRQLAQVLAATGADEQRLIAAAGRLPPSTREFAALAVPAQLPRAIPGFVGRTAEMEILTGTLNLAMPVVSAVTGPPGIGKTELAVHWGHTVIDRFPDGQLYANLRGFAEDGPVDPAAVACGFLEALAVPASQIPAASEAQLGLFRSMLSGRRMLVLLDNAHDAEQVRPLLPSANGIAVLVTSRSQLSGLVATAGASLVQLKPLDDAEARCLLQARIGQTSVYAEPALSSIIIRCAGLPLALSIVAARAITHPAFSLTDLADELAGDASLGAFNGHDSATDVRTVFSWSYRRLSPDAAGLFRLLGLHAGPEVSVAAAASLGAVSL